MALEDVTVASSVDASGNTITTAVSNDNLTNDDFLKLMLEELKLQDPTKPMDSAAMLDSQMQMSTIETNLSTIKAMESLTTSFTQMALAGATDLIGRVVENGEYGESGDLKGFSISSVEQIDGEVWAKGFEVTGYDSESGGLILADEPSTLKYANITKIY